MSDPHELPRFSGPRLPSEESRESEIDPEKFRRLTKVEETDESQKKKKRTPTEQEEEEGEEVAESKAPTQAFSQFMDDSKSDSDLNIQKPTGRVRRAPTEEAAPSDYDTEVYSAPKSSFSGQFMGKDKGEELGDDLFEGLPEAPPEYGEPAPPATGQAKSPPPPQEAPAQPTQEQPSEAPVPQDEPAIQEPTASSQPQSSGQDTSSGHKTKENGKSKEANATKKKKLKHLEFEAEKPKTTESHLKKGEVKGENPTEHKPQEESVQTHQVKKTAPTEGIAVEPTHKSESPIQAPHSSEMDHNDEDDDQEGGHQKHETHLDMPGFHDHDSPKKEAPAKGGFDEAIKKAKKKPSEGQIEEVAAQGGATHELHGAPPVEEEPLPATSQGKKSERKGAKGAISQPDLPVLYDSDGKVLTDLSKDSEKHDQQDQEQGPMQVQNIQPVIAPPPTEAAAYSKLQPEVFDLFERLVGLMTIELHSGKTTTTVTLNMPESIFNKSKIIIDHFDTAPHAFNLQLQGSDQAVNMFSENMAALAAAFEGSKLAYQVNIRRPELLPTEKHLFKRKSADYSDDNQQQGT